MIRQALKMSREKYVEVQIEKDQIVMILENSSGGIMKMELTPEDLEELTDLMMDCFYKAQQLKNQVGKEVTNVE